MRSKAERKFWDEKNFISIQGSAEKTCLGKKSVNLVAAGQSFHWFNPSLSKVEFRRILRETGNVALIWNTRSSDGSELNVGYENICRKYSVGYHGSGSLGFNDDAIGNFFSGDFIYRSMRSSQNLDFKGLLGRYMSASYSLRKEDPLFHEVSDRMEELFKKYSRDNHVELLYDTEIYIGKP